MQIAGFEKYQGSPKSGATCIDTVDQIWRWDASKGDWAKYFYCKSKGVLVGWANEGEKVLTEDTIPAGEGFFFRRANGEATDTLTFSYGTAAE